MPGGWVLRGARLNANGDLLDSAPIAITDLGGQVGNPAVGFGSVWVPTSENEIVDRYDLKTGKLQKRIRAGSAHATVQNEYFDSVAVGAKSD